MDSVVDVRCRFLRDDAGKHSFQLYNSASSNIMWTSLDWWPTRAEAEDESKKLRRKVAEHMRHAGLTVQEAANGDFNITLPKTLPGGKPVMILCALVSNAEGKYGFEVFTDRDEILIKPKAYYDTPQAAFRAAHEQRNEIAQELKELGFDQLTFLENPAEMPNFADTPKIGMTTKLDPKCKPLYPFFPSHIDPRVN